MALITGGDTGETLDGTVDDDEIRGNGGDDILNGDDGDDELFGGDGDDELYGDSGNDSLLGQDGDDLLNDSSGDNYFNGGAGNDTIRGTGQAFEGGYGDDFISAYSAFVGGIRQSVVVYGGEGADNISLFGSHVDGNEISGDGGADTIYASSAADLIFGGDGVDNITANAGDDDIYGGNDGDYISGGTGEDILRGEDGDDTLDGGLQADEFYGGAGLDEFRISATQSDGDVVHDFETGEIIQLTLTSFLEKTDFTTSGSSELRYEHTASDTLFYWDTNGDGNSDASFTVKGLFDFASIGNNKIEGWAIVDRDFNSNGTTDLMFQLAGNGSYVRLDDPASGNPPSSEARTGFESIGLADMDGDGVLDNVIRAANNNYVIQFSGENTGASTVGGNAFNITAFADIDGDGADEALGTSTDPGDQRVYLIDDALQTVTRIGFNAHELIGAGDFDGDGSDEALLEQASGGKRLYDDSLGSVSVGRAILEAEAIGDFNGDGLDDVLTTNPNKNGHYYLLEGDAANPLGDATFIGYQSLELVAAGDFDGDGTLDILGNQNGTSFQMLTNGLTTLTAINFGNDTFEAIGDFNGDGMDDILLSRPNEQGRLIYSGDRNNTALIDALIGKSVRDVADYDGDGSDDLLVQDDVDGSYSILLSGVGSEIDLDASLDNADVIDPNGLDMLGFY